MARKNILFVGFGDLARRACALLAAHRRVGVARSPKPVPQGVELWQGAVADPGVRERVGAEAWDAVVITLTPDGYSDAAYRAAYVDTLRALLEVWQARPPGLVLFASSTGVYGQTDGSWVDEASPTAPSSFSGTRLLEAEALLQSAPTRSCVVRFAGIYGPGRDFLIRQVREGKGGSDDYTNRIHADDCAGVIAHLLEAHFGGASIEPLYVAADCEPITGRQVREWLAERLGVPRERLQPSDSVRAGSKRCSNRLLLRSGYRFQYPSYREGYGSVLDGS